MTASLKPSPVMNSFTDGHARRAKVTVAAQCMHMHWQQPMDTQQAAPLTTTLLSSRWQTPAAARTAARARPPAARRALRARPSQCRPRLAPPRPTAVLLQRAPLPRGLTRPTAHLPRHLRANARSPFGTSHSAKGSMQLIMWQPDIVGVAHFVMDCFDLLGAVPDAHDDGFSDSD